MDSENQQVVYESEDGLWRYERNSQWQAFMAQKRQITDPVIRQHTINRKELAEFINQQAHPDCPGYWGELTSVEPYWQVVLNTHFASLLGLSELAPVQLPVMGAKDHIGHVLTALRQQSRLPFADLQEHKANQLWSAPHTPTFRPPQKTMPSATRWDNLESYLCLHFSRFAFPSVTGQDFETCVSIALRAAQLSFYAQHDVKTLRWLEQHLSQPYWGEDGAVKTLLSQVKQMLSLVGDAEPSASMKRYVELMIEHGVHTPISLNIASDLLPLYETVKLTLAEGVSPERIVDLLPLPRYRFICDGEFSLNELTLGSRIARGSV